MNSVEKNVKKIEEILNSNELIYIYNEEKEYFLLGFELPGKLSRMQIIMSVKEDYVMVYGCIELKATDDVINSVAEYLTRINYGMIFGNFELDYSDGEIRFKLAIDAKSGITEEDVNKAIAIVYGSLLKYGDGLLEVLSNANTPEEVANRVEKEILSKKLEL